MDATDRMEALLPPLAAPLTQFSVIWIPDAVAEELAAHPDPDAREAIQTAVQEQWIRGFHVPFRHKVRNVRRQTVVFSYLDDVIDTPGLLVQIGPMIDRRIMFEGKEGEVVHPVMGFQVIEETSQERYPPFGVRPYLHVFLRSFKRWSAQFGARHEPVDRDGELQVYGAPLSSGSIRWPSGSSPISMRDSG